MLEQDIVVEIPVADDVDVANLRNRTLFDVETDRYAVALQWADDGLDRGSVFALGQILAFDLLLGTVEHGAVKNQPFGQADLLEPLQHLVAGEGFVAVEPD